MPHRATRRFPPILAIVAALFCDSIGSDRAAAQTYAERVVTGLDGPLAGTYAPGDPTRLFIDDIWKGQIKIVDLVAHTVLPTPFLVINDLPNPLHSGEQGLLGVTFDPGYATNGYFYVDYTRDDNSLEVRRYRVLGDPATSNVADPDSGHTIINIPKEAPWHNAGWLGFGPNDGYLYINVGDPGGNQAQDLTDNLLGKVLRLDVRDVSPDAYPSDPSRNYALPPTNPYVGIEGDDEIWAYGLRNPWRASFDRQTGDLWINDTGQNDREEVDYQAADSPGGINYGWQIREGTAGGPTPPGLTDPVYDYSHVDANGNFQGNAITASAFYRGPVADFQGHYFFSDLGSGSIWKLDPDAVDIRASVTKVNNLLVPDTTNGGPLRAIVSFGEDSIGNVYLIEWDFAPDGDIFRIATASKDAVWNGNNATAGAAGDGTDWSAANNWTRGAAIDAAVVDQDQVIFAAGSSQSVINLGANRVVSAVTFAAPYTLNGNTLKVVSGNVTVDAGVTAVVHSELVAETANHSIRKLGTGTLLVEGLAGQVAVKAGTLGGSGTLDYLTVRDGGTVAPGASTGIMSVTHSFTMYDGAALAFEIGGNSNANPASPQFDQLVITGAAKVAGALSVNFIDLGAGVFSPASGDSFALLSAAGGLTGTFGVVNLPALASGLVWREIVSANAFSLSVVSRLAGDYNDDLVVDAADYAVWRRMSGNTGPSLAADGSGPTGSPDGVVDDFDYDFWRAHFGETAMNPASAAAVPEPTALTLALLLAAIASMSRRAIR